jgi:hypothetical protein
LAAGWPLKLSAFVETLFKSELGAILRLAEGARSGVAEAFCVQVGMVAGARSHRQLTLPIVGC